MSAIGLLLGLLVLSYLGGMLRGARAIRGFGLPSGSEYLCLGFVFGSQVLDLIPLPLLLSFRPLLLVGAAWIAFVEGLGYTRVGDRAIGLGNAVMGVVFSLFFLRKGRVMPLIVAHTLLDVVAFVGYTLLPSSWLNWL